MTDTQANIHLSIAVRTILILGFTFGTQSLWGSRWSFSYPRILSKHVPKIIEKVGMTPIVSGCELRGCCPGCVPSSPIDWRIQLEGPAFSSLKLRPQQQDQRPFVNIKCTGAVELIDGDYKFERGHSICENVPRLKDGQTLVVFPSLTADQQALSDDNIQGEGRLVIEQVLRQPNRPVVINSFTLIYTIRPSGPFSLATTDQVDTIGGAGGGTPVILADFNTGLGGTDICNNDLIFESIPAPVPIGNATADGTCNSEVSIFSENNAMSFKSSPYPWTVKTGETYTATLATRIQVPISVWVASSYVTRTAIDTWFKTTNDLFLANRVGVEFIDNCTATACTDVTAYSSVIGAGCWENVNEIKNHEDTFKLFDYGKINVYFVDPASPSPQGPNSVGSGEHCGYAMPSEPNMIYIPRNAAASTLAHELGHALGLSPDNRGGDSNCASSATSCKFTSVNIMWARSTNTRTDFFIGQSYRMNLHPASMLNANGTRIGPVRYCDPQQGLLESDKLCPPVWWPGSP